MSKPSDIVTIALAEVGYREKASNANLDDKTANSGAANWTKYARVSKPTERSRASASSASLVRSELAVSSPRSTTSRKGGMTATRKSVIRCSFSPAARSVTLESWSKSPTLPS